MKIDSFVKFTDEQIMQNTQWVEDELNRVYNIARKDRLLYCVCVYWSPVTKNLESRVAYFEDPFERSLWKEYIDKTYNKLDTPYHIYEN